MVSFEAYGIYLFVDVNPVLLGVPESEMRTMGQPPVILLEDEIKKMRIACKVGIRAIASPESESPCLLSSDSVAKFRPYLAPLLA